MVLLRRVVSNICGLEGSDAALWWGYNYRVVVTSTCGGVALASAGSVRKGAFIRCPDLPPTCNVVVKQALNVGRRISKISSSGFDRSDFTNVAHCYVARTVVLLNKRCCAREDGRLRARVFDIEMVRHTRRAARAWCVVILVWWWGEVPDLFKLVFGDTRNCQGSSNLPPLLCAHPCWP